MGKIYLSDESYSKLTRMLENQISTAAGRKMLEYGSGTCSLAELLRPDLEYLACTDKDPAALNALLPDPGTTETVLIPDEELGEDCYFGRFHMVYVLFSLHDMSHLVDELMRLRRLIIKGGKLVIIDFCENDFDAECSKQLKRCGFPDQKTDHFEIDGKAAFLTAAEK